MPFLNKHFLFSSVFITGYLCIELLGISKVNAQAFLVGNSTISNEDTDGSSEVMANEESEESISQVVSVSQLLDVKPSDWAFQALQSLVERYGCLEGYPDRTFQGNRSITRYEFAASVSVCMIRISELMSRNPDLVQKRDLVYVDQLQRIFNAEIASLKGRIQSLEERSDGLTSRQFSTTTKLFGQVVIGVQGRLPNRADFFPVDGIKDIDDPGANLNVTSNAQLSLVTQFSPNSLLLIGLQAGSGSSAPRLSNDFRLGYEGDTGNQLLLSDLTYRHRIGNKLGLIVGPTGVTPVNVFRGTNRVESAGAGPLSAFAQRNPIISLGAGRGGLGFDWQISPSLALQGVYSTSFPNLSDVGGLFGGRSGSTTFGTQLNIAVTKKFDIALNYLYGYTPRDSFAGRLGTGVGDEQVTVNEALLTQAIGSTVSWRVSDRLIAGGWVGGTFSRIPDTPGEVTTLNWMGFLNFPDLFGKGNLGGLYVGQPPRITNSTLPTGKNIPSLLAGGIGTSGGQSGTTIHTEAFIRYRLNDWMSITPGLIVVFNPANTSSSDPVVIGAIRTTFNF